MKNVLESYKGFEGIKRLVDVGGGLGININLITSKYPYIHGINFDLPHVIQDAPSYPGMYYPCTFQPCGCGKLKKKFFFFLLNRVIC